MKRYIPLIILFLISFYLWTLPLQKNKLPFGEGDAAWHFANSDYAAQADRSFWRLPNYIGLWYYGYNKILGVNALEYPPPYHLNGGIMQIVGGDRIVPIYLYIVITSFSIIFTLYFLIKKLYGSLPAFIAGFSLIFSIRDIMVYLWGQRPTTASYAYIPLILFCFYRYIVSLIKRCSDKKYLIIGVLLLVSQYYFHIQGFIISFVILTVFVIFMFLKYKFTIEFKEIRFIILVSSLFLAMSLPFILIYLGASTSIPLRINSLHRLFYWYKPVGGYPVANIPYTKVYGFYAFPFLFVGIFYALARRKPQDILLLSWLIGMYIVLHFDVVGFGSIPRVERMLIPEAYIFYSFISLGVVKLAYFLKLNTKIKGYVTLIAILVFIIFLIYFQGNNAYITLKNAYIGILRITPYQYEIAKWIDKNLPQDAIIYNVGQLTYPKERFISMLAKRAGVTQGSYVHFYNRTGREPNYVLIDYSDLILVKDREPFNQYYNLVKEWEESVRDRLILIQQGRFHRIYKINKSLMDKQGNFPHRFV